MRGAQTRGGHEQRAAPIVPSHAGRPVPTLPRGEMAVAAFPVAADPRPGHRFFRGRLVHVPHHLRLCARPHVVPDGHRRSGVVGSGERQDAALRDGRGDQRDRAGKQRGAVPARLWPPRLRPLFDGGSLPGQDGACPPLADVRTGGLPGAADRVDRHGPMAVVAAVPSRRVAGDTGPGAGRGSRFLPVSAPALGGGQRLAAPTGNRRDRLRYLRVSRRRETPLSGGWSELFEEGGRGISPSSALHLRCFRGSTTC